MSWNDVNLAGINITIEPVAIGEYTFELNPGTKMSEDGKRIEASATIVGDSPFAGRKMFFSYPDPQTYDWSPRVLRRLVNALGVEPVEGESPVETLSRAANLRFAAPVKDGKTSEAYPTPKRELDIFKVKAAA